MEVPDEELEQIVRIALESRRRVKEQQKKCLKSEFRNTHFSFTLGVDGVEQFVCDAGAAQRRSHRRRSAAAGPSVGDQPWLAGVWRRAVPDRGHVRPGQRRPRS